MSREPGPGQVPPLLLQWAARPGAARILTEARRRAEQGTLGHKGRLNVPLSSSERQDVGILLGVGWEVGLGPTLLAPLRRVLGGYGVTLDDLLVATGGPVRDRAAERRAVAGDRAEDARRARELLVNAFGAPLADRVVARCLPRAGDGAQVARARDLARVATVLDGLDEPVGLAVLAVRCFGDAHALDRTRPLGRAAARTLQLRAGGSVEAIQVTEGWRASWASAGVACDRVSSTVLVLNLPLVGSPAIETGSSVMGEPMWLTARLLELPGLGAPAAAGQDVFVCENPSVVEAAADRLGLLCAPLVCTYGKPSMAALLLLRTLDASGARLHVRADDDEAGRAIVASLLQECPGATSWRYDAGGPMYEEELIEALIADLRRS